MTPSDRFPDWFPTPVAGTSRRPVPHTGNQSPRGTTKTLQPQRIDRFPTGSPTGSPQVPNRLVPRSLLSRNGNQSSTPTGNHPTTTTPTTKKQDHPMTNVLGIDPSLTGTGYAFIETGGRVSALGTIKTKSGADDIASRLARFDHILGEFGSALDYADLVVIEQPAYNSRTGKAHDRSGLWWYLAEHIVHFQRTPIVEVTPTARATYATGKGNASKDTVLANVVRRYPTADVQDNNQADALVLAAIGARHLGSPIEDQLPQTHLRALDKIVWPATAEVA